MYASVISPPQSNVSLYVSSLYHADSNFFWSWASVEFAVTGTGMVDGVYTGSTINYFFQGLLAAAAGGSVRWMDVRIFYYNFDQAFVGPGGGLLTGGVCPVCPSICPRFAPPWIGQAMAMNAIRPCISVNMRVVRIASVISFILSLGAIPACFGPFYCHKLVETARTPAVEAEARRWARSFRAADVSIGDVEEFDGVVPGMRWLGHKLDNKLFGFDGDGHVRLVGPSPIDIRDGAIGENVDSLMFTERSRTGILVKLPTKSDFGVPSKDLVKVTEDIAVLCEP